VAEALHAEKLILLTDVPGVLDANGVLMPQLTIPRRASTSPRARSAAA
jgi:acetylglutamate kinase